MDSYTFLIWYIISQSTIWFECIFFPVVLRRMRAMASSFLTFLDHTRHSTVGRSPLDEWSTRSWDIYLITHNNHKRRTSMSQRDLNPQSQQASRRRFTPYTARPLRSAYLNVMCHLVSLVISCVLIFIKLLDNRYLFSAMNMSHWTNI